MSDTPAVPSLEYESGRDRRQRIPRTAGFQLFLAITIALGMTAGGVAVYRPVASYVGPRYDRWKTVRQRDAAFRELAEYRSAIDVVFDERAEKVPAIRYLRGSGWYGERGEHVQRNTRADGDDIRGNRNWSDLISIDGWTPGLPDAIDRHDAAESRLSGARVPGRAAPIRGPFRVDNHWTGEVRAPLFVHARQVAPNALPVIIILTFDGPAFVWGDPSPLWVRLIRRPGEVSAFVGVRDFVFATDPTLPVRLYAGEPDPADASHFTIRYDAGGVPGTIDGWLRADDTVTLQVRDGPGKRGE